MVGRLRSRALSDGKEEPYKHGLTVVQSGR